MKEVTNSYSTPQHKDLILQKVRNNLHEFNFEDASMTVFQSYSNSQAQMDSINNSEDEDEQEAILLDEDGDSLITLKKNITGCQPQSTPALIDRYNSRQDDKTTLLNNKIKRNSIKKCSQDNFFNIINVKVKARIIQQKFFNSKVKYCEDDIGNDKSLLKNGKSQGEGTKEDNQLARIQQFYQQPLSSDDANDNKIRFGQMEDNIPIDDERSVTSTHNDSNSFPILIKSAFQMRFYQTGTTLRIFCKQIEYLSSQQQFL